jgi:acetylornithine deacetylase/succinyl-diaminopimelate desuccinylase-like protein
VVPRRKRNVVVESENIICKEKYPQKGEMIMDTNINWDSATDETVRHLSQLIQAQTVNPPGNELPAILLIKDILLKEGFSEEEVVIVESGPNRVNLIVRQKGDGSQRPVMMSGHVDVVPVEREHWTHDPFGGEIIDGYVWGRGAMDMKGFLSMYLQVFLQAHRQKLPLKRDLILAAIADEEAGFEYGSKFLVSQHPDLIDAEYGITEGGAFTMWMGSTKAYMIQVAEKGVCWLKMTAHGRPGHGSLPHDENAVVYLADAIACLKRADHLPIHITPTFSGMLKAAGKQIKSPVGGLIGTLGNPAAVNLILKNTSGSTRMMLKALTSNTCTPTVLSGGTKTNVIPSEASVNLDCRKLPGQSPDDVMREILAITGDKVTLEILDVSDGNESPIDTPFYQMMEKVTRKMDPEGIVIPLLMPGATDACVYTQAGIKVYGFTPGILPADYPVMSMGHAHDERLPISYIRSGLPTLWEAISGFCRV